MKLASIKQKIRELTNVRKFELTDAQREGKLELGEFFVFGLRDGHFAAAHKTSGEVQYFAISGDPKPALFQAQIEALYSETLASCMGSVVRASYVYILPEDYPPFKSNLQAERDNYQHLSSFDVTWIKAPTKALTQIAFKMLYKTGTRYIVLGAREHEIEPIGPNFVRRASLKDWHVNMRSDFIEINALGSTSDAFYYSSNYKNGVLKMPISHPKTHILALAPKKYWADMGIFWKKARNGKEYLCFEMVGEYLQSLSAKVGEYSLTNMLSSGYYFNSKTSKCYARSGFITYGVAPKGVQHAYGRYIYVPKMPEREPRIKFLREIFDSFCWAEPHMGRVLLGWVLLAPFSGALKFRPHCWINGETSAGKTWVFENVVCPLLGDLYCGFTMGTTEAGLIRGLQGMALPVVHDEFESDQQNKAVHKQRLVEFFRGCSTSTGDQMSITKGVQGGNATQSFKSACMVLLGSIKNCLETPQDTARFIVLELNKRMRKKIFNEVRYKCEGNASELNDIFKVHVDKVFHEFKSVLYNIRRSEKNIKESYPDLSDHSARCIAGVDGMLKFYGMELNPEELKKTVDKFKIHAIRESDNMLDSIFLQEFWHDSHKRNLLYYIRGAIRRLGQKDGVYDNTLKWFGIKMHVEGKKVDITINTRNRIFAHYIGKNMGARNWRALLMNDERVEPISDQSFKISDLFSYIGGVDGNSKGKESEQA